MKYKVKNTAKGSQAIEVKGGGHAVLKPGEERVITAPAAYNKERIAELDKAGIKVTPEDGKAK